MKVVNKLTELKDQLAKTDEKSIVGFVPTMGALHNGHISLVNRCRKECNTVIISIFVNPTQFNDKNDLKNYPRTLDKDLSLLKEADVDLVFVPDVNEMYPTPDTRVFDFGNLETVMEGASRPGHFNGVAQVVSKLFDMINPDKAYFGEKDFQQLAIIRCMVKQLGYNLEIIGCDIERDIDGLALSSRNMLLDQEQRKAAPQIYETLKDAVGHKESMSVDEVVKFVYQRINDNKLFEIDYFSIVNSLSLQPVKTWDDAVSIQGCIAVKVGNIRLIDNIKFV